jgi:hypothetical protein
MHQLNVVMVCLISFIKFGTLFTWFGMSWVMPRKNYRLVCLLVEFWKADEWCDLEDGANLHFLVCFEGNKS